MYYLMNIHIRPRAIYLCRVSVYIQYMYIVHCVICYNIINVTSTVRVYVTCMVGLEVIQNYQNEENR